MASFHFLWKENYVNHQKFSKFYNHDSLQNFLSLFMSLLTAPIVKNSHILAGVYFIFLKNILDQSSKSFNIKSWPQGLRVTKTVKKPSLKEPGGSCFQRQLYTKYLRQTQVFMWNSALREKFNIYFWGVFC